MNLKVIAASWSPRHQSPLATQVAAGGLATPHWRPQSRRPGGRPEWERLSPGGDDKVQHVHNDKSVLQGQPTQPGDAMASHGAVCSEALHAATVSTPVIATPLASALPRPSRHDAGGPHDACGQQANDEAPWIRVSGTELALQ